MRAAIMAMLALAGCATTVGGQALEGVEWRAADLNGAPILAGAPLTLRLDGGRAAGSAGCNSFSGAYRLRSDAKIDIDAVATTRRACAEDVMDQERRYLSILENAASYGVYRDGSLSLISPDGRAVRFRQ